MAGSFWHSRKQDPPLPKEPGIDRIQVSELPKATRRSKPPSKQRHDRLRSIERDLILLQRREERLRLFGYVRLKNGEVLSIDDAIARLRDGLRAEENPNIVGGIGKDDILEWHVAESVRDVIDSKGEIDVPKGACYPALGIGEGTVLLDPKLRHKDPALRGR